ncbi:MAG: type III secretion protein [Chloroflexi bacterium]|nr:MAG: type III secretion protein [Chloroflexota bacterium]RLT47225.1 MAG: type III secretion protein [Chloroflexota bacterium]RLT53530.1 MAG: type III secretion protein [Chloroflexota bacterium]
MDHAKTSGFYGPHVSADAFDGEVARASAMTISVAQFQLFVLSATRTLAILSGVPVLGSTVVPVRVRLAAGLLITLVIVPLVPAAAAGEPAPAGGFLVLAAMELLTGLLAGFVVRTTFAALAVGANLIGTLAGFSAAQFVNPLTNMQGSPLDQLILLFSTTVFLVINGHHQLIVAISRLFELVPLGTFVMGPAVKDGLVRLTLGMWVSGVQIALPIVATILAVDVAMGLLAKTAPQIQVFFLSLPLKIAIGLLGVTALLPLLLPVLHNMFNDTARHMLELVHAQ